MEQKGYKKLSVFLSLILRHQPQAAGINLDKNGWADVEDLLRIQGDYKKMILTGNKLPDQIRVYVDELSEIC